MKKNKGASLVGVVITILVIMLILSVGVCAYLLKNPVKESAVVQNPEQVTTANSSSEVKDEVIKNTELTSEERYSNFLKKLKTNLMKESNTIEYNWILSGKYGIDNITVDSDGNAIVKLNGTLANKYGKEYKIAKNVVTAGIETYGQDATVLLWFIDSDGKFIYIKDINSSNNSLDIKENKNIKNIVSVRSIQGEPIPIAIDIDGNIYDLYE